MYQYFHDLAIRIHGKLEASYEEIQHPSIRL